MCPMPMKPMFGFKWSPSILIAIPLFHQKWSVMILLAIHLKIYYHTYKNEVRGESGVSSHCPRPPPPAWSVSNNYEYTWNTPGSQCPSDGMSLPITSHGFAPVGHVTRPVPPSR